MTSAHTAAIANAHRASIDARLATIVSAKLGCAVSLLRYDAHPRTHIETPIFAVPAAMADRARSLGLTVELT